MGTNGMNRKLQIGRPGTGFATVAMILSWVVAAALLGRNAMLWLATGCILVGLIIAAVCLMRTQGSVRRFTTELYARFLLGAARRML